MTSAGHHHGAGVKLRERSQQAQGIVFFLMAKDIEIYGNIKNQEMMLHALSSLSPQ